MKKHVSKIMFVDNNFAMMRIVILQFGLCNIIF